MILKHQTNSIGTINTNSIGTINTHSISKVA